MQELFMTILRGTTVFMGRLSYGPREVSLSDVREFWKNFLCEFFLVSESVRQVTERATGHAFVKHEFVNME